jgi:hypothetical protein
MTIPAGPQAARPGEAIQVGVCIGEAEYSAALPGGGSALTRVRTTHQSRGQDGDGPNGPKLFFVAWQATGICRRLCF